MQILSHLFEKLCVILQTGWGWTIWVSFFVSNYFAGHKFIVFLVIAVTLLDALWGICVSVRHGHFTLSELARHTITKLGVYGSAMFVFVGIDKVADTVLTASVVGSAIVLVEFWSSCASMLILNPHLPFLRLLKRTLTGEIASKLHIPEDDVERVLKEEEMSMSNRKRKGEA